MLDLNSETLLGNSFGFLLVALLRQHLGKLNRYLLVGDPLVHLPKLERHEGLQEPSPVVGAGGVSLLEDVLGQLAVELGADVGQVRLDVDELLSNIGCGRHRTVMEEGRGLVPAGTTHKV